MEHVSTILLAITDEAEWHEIIALLREELGYRVLLAHDTRTLLRRLQEARIDLVICEARLGREDGLEALRQCRVRSPGSLRILVKDPDCARRMRPHEADRAAIYQFLRKPLDVEQVGLVAKRALEAAELARRHRLLSREFKLHDEGTQPLLEGVVLGSEPATCRQFERLIYVSEAMARLCATARQAAPTDLPVLVQGETGTGKELLARAIHFHSRRANAPLLVQNCGGVPDELLHSELFGHRRGAFTGAVSDRLGLFRAADGGTVFLDEISDISPAFQVSLLRFLQEGEVKPLGDDRTYRADVRIICATNVPLEKLVEEGRFRRDLYYRLKGFELNIPPLRERPEDIPVLTEFFVRRYSEEMNVRLLGISRQVLEQLKHYPFPGNVRELENEIRRMVAMARDGEYLTSDHLSPAIASARLRRTTPGQVNGVDVLSSLQGRTLKEKVEALERMLVAEALQRCQGNQSRAAAELGLSRVGLANKIRRYGLKCRMETSHE